ncbi:MAG: cytochrome c [Ilumatobacteraceae bacterium]
MIAASNSTNFAWFLALVIAVGWAVYAFFNVRSGRAEVGSEIELAANRKQYYDDETLEGPKLERTQLLAVLLLGVIAITLPVYWLMEPQRAANADTGTTTKFVKWGAELFETTANGGFNCAGCHGGMKGTGGVAPYAITDPKTGEVISVSWLAPALNTVLYRFSEDEVRFILTYGRPFSPMSPWGLDGGGPMNEQQIQTLITYLESIQIQPVGCTTDTPFSSTADPAVCDGGTLPLENQQEIDARADQLVANGTYASRGEALFNLDLASGAYSCARCHTSGWSYGDPGVTGQGGLGWNLTGGSTNIRFPNSADMVSFIEAGSVYGKRYGNQAQGSGRMPGFGHMLTEQQITEIVDYVRSL